jgi:hypothetical protein
VPYGGVPTNFALDNAAKRLVVSYTKSPLLEVFGVSIGGDNLDVASLGLVRGPPWKKSMSDKARGKRVEGQSLFQEDLWERATCIDMGFVEGALGAKGKLFVGAWNQDDSAQAAFVPFYLDENAI